MATYPVELQGGISGLSAGQVASIGKAPFMGHLQNVASLGTKQPRVLCSAVGQWFMDNMPHGDFSGTAVGGSGGPAALPYGPTGLDTVVSIGMVKTSNTTSSFTGDQSINYEHGTYTYKIKCAHLRGTSVAVTGADWTASTRSISTNGSNGFASYTYTGDDWCQVTAATGGTTGWYRIQSKDSDDAITLTADASILSSTDLGNVVNATVRPSYIATSITGATWTNATATITKTGAFSSYTPTADDTVYVKAGTGLLATDGSYAKVLSKTDADSIVIDAVDIVDDGSTDVEFVLLKRPTFETKDIDTGLADGTTVTTATAFSFTPQVGDLYYIYIDTGNDPGEENDPESIPTASAASTLNCMWPYGVFNAVVKSSTQGHAGVSTLVSARQNTDMHHYWWGSFTTPKECFLYGDELKLDMHGDFLYNNTPFIFEVVLIPNFDPEADWSKAFYPFDGETGNSNRLTSSAIWFQSDPITVTGTRPVNIEVTGNAGGITTGASGGTATYSFFWECDFKIGNTSTTYSTDDISVTRRIVTKTYTDSDFNWRASDVRWTVLLKTEHPSLKGFPGFHGYYPGEPFSCTTGNGGSLLYHGGQNSGNLPFAPRTRWSRMSVVWTPGGSY